MMTDHYHCTRCKKTQSREFLTAKRVNFTTMGNRAKIKRSRTTDWLCPDCLVKDPIWQMQSKMGSFPKERT